MTQEEKAKAYDEAIRKAKITLGCCDSASIITEHTIYDIFPELAENEDERIRKALIKLFETENYSGFVTLDGIDIEDVLAWLEKRGDKDGQAIYPTFTFDDILALQCCMETVKKVQEDKDLYEKLEDLHGRLYDVYQLEKQGEKPQGKSALEAINEEKMNNSNSVNGIPFDYEHATITQKDFAESNKPKFNIGDWIVWYNCIYQVLDNNLTYVVIDTKGLESRYEHSTIDKVARYWTIQDAKDGDVLAAHECIVLFKEIDGLNIKCYCTYHYMGFSPSFHIDTLQNKDAFHPATKEQRDTLMKAIADAGYEWDADKKEVKLLITNGGDFDTENCEQKSAWSEEDENISKDIINYLKVANELIPQFQTDKWIAWLEKQKPQRIISAEAKEALYDKVEPKFGVDDWITNGEFTWKITDVGYFDYDLVSPEGKHVTDSVSHVDENFRLCTAEEAYKIGYSKGISDMREENEQAIKAAINLERKRMEKQDNKKS